MTGSAMALAQAPGSGQGGPGFGDHRPPFERAMGSFGEHGKWWHNPKVVAELKLTDDQQKAMDGILLQHRETLIDLRAGLERAELGLEPLMGQDQPDETKILAQIDTVAQARAELEKANARFLLALRAKLAPEQWKQLQADRASHRMPGHGWGPSGTGPDGQYHHRQMPPPPAGQPSQDGVPAPPSGDME
jgi:protein CpxP